MFTEEGQYPVSAYGLEAIMTCGFSRKQFEKLVWQHSQDDFQKLVKRVRHAGAVVVGGYSPYGMVDGFTKAFLGRLFSLRHPNGLCRDKLAAATAADDAAPPIKRRLEP